MTAEIEEINGGGDGEKTNVGKKNAYVCPVCLRTIVTVDMDVGVTPATLACQNARCSGDAMMRSMFYSIDQALPPAYEWRKPTPEKVEEILASIEDEQIRDAAAKDFEDGLLTLVALEAGQRNTTMDTVGRLKKEMVEGESYNVRVRTRCGGEYVRQFIAPLHDLVNIPLIDFTAIPPGAELDEETVARLMENGDVRQFALATNTDPATGKVWFEYLELKMRRSAAMDKLVRATAMPKMPGPARPPKRRRV